jgi:hypothetical protein
MKPPKNLLNKTKFRRQTPKKLENKAGLMGKLKQLMQAYKNGISGLYSGWKNVFQLRSKNRNQLTWEEHKLVFQTQMDTIRSLPVVVFFMIPIVGYFVPLVVMYFPKLLPLSFATEDQKVLLRNSFIEQQRKSSIAIFKYLQGITPLTALLSKIESGSSVSDEELLGVRSIFENEAGLSNLNRKQLLELCQFANLPFGKIMPSFILRKRLERFAVYLFRGDTILIQNPSVKYLGINLELVEPAVRKNLTEACEERGFRDLQQFSLWLQLSAKMLISNQFSSPFYLHALMIKTFQHNQFYLN